MKKGLSFFAIVLAVIFSFQSIHSQDQKTDKQLIEEFIQKKKDFNKEFGYGFRIQLYNGFEVEAKKTQAKFRIEFPEIRTYLVYRQPEWKIQIGLHKTQLEADRAINELELKKKFGAGVIVVPLGK